MIIFVDNEHEEGYKRPWGEKVMAMRTKIKYRLEDITADDCLLVRYNRVSPDMLDRYRARALFISGNSAEPHFYQPAETAGLRTILKEQKLPIFGFCGGFQVLGEALGVPLDLMGYIDPPEYDEEGKQKQIREFGYEPIELLKEHPVLNGLDATPVVRHAHRFELKEVPADFEVLASTGMCPIQMIAHKQRPVVGTQFHPEYFTDEHPAGRIMIENFCRMAGLID